MKMRSLLLTLLIFTACATSKEGSYPHSHNPSTLPSPTSSPSPLPVPSVSPSSEPSVAPTAPDFGLLPSPEVFAVVGSGASAEFRPGGVDEEYTKEALSYLNNAFKSGCVRNKVVSHLYKTLEKEENPQLKVTETVKAWNLYVKGAPYALDLRWYTKFGSKAIGYTFVYRDDVKGAPSETRIWTNWKKVGSSLFYGAHLAHEISHQLRAGGYLHNSMFGGSFPYDTGDIVEQCALLQSKARIYQIPRESILKQQLDKKKAA